MSATSSAGALRIAIDRFLRPVAYQNAPQELLPAPLQDANPWNVSRRIDGSVVPADRTAPPPAKDDPTNRRSSV